MQNISIENLEKQIAQFAHMQNQLDFECFVKNTVPKYEDAPYLKYLFKELMQFYRDLLDRKSPRLIVNMPPRHLKSESITVRFSLFCMVNNPNFEIITASANQDLADKFSRSARDVMSNSYIKETYELDIANNNKSISQWAITNKSSYKAVGMDGTTTGFGANLLIIDDPIRSPKDAESKRLKDQQFDWFDAVAETRLAPTNGIIIVLTRWAQDDLAGRLLERFPDDWKVIKFKAIAEEDEPFRKAGETLHAKRFPIERMLKIKANKSPHVWSSLYQQEPRVKEGNLFKNEYFEKRYFNSELPPDFDFILTAWDFPYAESSTSDFVAGVTMGLKGNSIYILNLVHGRMDFPTVLPKVISESITFKTHAILVEARANGQAIIDTVKTKVNGVIAIHPKENKVTRANSITPMLESGQVLFPQEDDAKWMSTFTNELLSFPRAQNDDIVDAFSHGLNYLREKISSDNQISDIDLCSGLYFRGDFSSW